MQTADATHNIKPAKSVVHLAAAAMAAHDEYMQAAEPYFEFRGAAPPAADKAIGVALRRHSRLSTRLAQTPAPNTAAMEAKAAVLLSEMTLQPDGTVRSDDRALALAYSLVRDILGDGFGAALDRIMPPHHRTA